MEIQELLEQVKAGTLSIEEAKQYLRKEPFEELGYAKLDTHRKLRTGHAEVIYCEGKSTEHFLEIFTHLYRENGEVFGTRASKEQYLAAKERFPQTVYDETSRIIRIEKNDKPHMGKIVVCSAGTADIFVAEEAALTAEYFGNYVERIYDIGVCGIHRMLANLDAIQSSDIGGLWCKFSRGFGTPDHDQFLCERGGSGQYRQRLWCRLYGIADQQVSRRTA